MTLPTRVPSQNLESEGMTGMFGETDHSTLDFDGLGRHGLLMARVVDFVVESEEKDNADVRCLTSEAFEWSAPVKRFNGSEIHDIGDVFQGEQPTVSWNTFISHNPISESLDVTPTPFGKILLLEIGFTLPGTDHEMAKNVEDALGYL